MKAGKLRHRVAVQTFDGTADELNQVQGSWSTDETRWARIEPLSGRAYEQAKQMHDEVSHKITMRHTDLDPDARLLYGSRVFHILSVLNIDERDKEIVIMAQEQV